MTLEVICTLFGEIIGTGGISGRTPLTAEDDEAAIDLAKLVIEVEKRFGITVQDEDVHTFQTLGDLAGYVDGLIDD